MLDRISWHGSPVSERSPSSNWQEQLLEWLVTVRDDPLAFVMGAFPWGEAGTQLEAYTGPMPWARDLMERIRVGLLSPEQAIQEAIASGHGIAKSRDPTQDQNLGRTRQVVQPMLVLARVLHAKRNLSRLQRPRTRTHLAHRYDPMVEDQPTSFRWPPQQRQTNADDLR